MLETFSRIYLLLIVKWTHARDIFIKSRCTDLRKSANYKDNELMSQVWNSGIGRLYLNAVEYQPRSGYCSSATIRSILKTLPFFNMQDLPPPKNSPVTLKSHASELERYGRGKIKCHIVYATDGFGLFMETIRKVVNPQYRISVNFLRSPLFGVNRWWSPVEIGSCFFGGHHSIIVGYFEESSLVAIYDVNPDYGLFFVDAKRLYDAVATYPLLGASGRPRGLVLCEISK